MPHFFVNYKLHATITGAVVIALLSSIITATTVWNRQSFIVDSLQKVVVADVNEISSLRIESIKLQDNIVALNTKISEFNMYGSKQSQKNTTDIVVLQSNFTNIKDTMSAIDKKNDDAHKSISDKLDMLQDFMYKLHNNKSVSVDMSNSKDKG
jgi:seryl-tRNA synthetase